jgi:hypothetical protein
MGRKAAQDVERLDECTCRLIVPVASDDQTPSQRGSGGIVIRERHVDEVVSGAAQQIRVEHEAKQSVLGKGRVHLGDGHGDASRTVRWIDANDASARTLGDPELLIRSPGNLPRALESRNQDPRRETLGRVGDDSRILCRGRDSDAREERSREPGYPLHPRTLAPS